MANKTARQKKLGPAPFASFEDLSEDLSSPESKGYQPMPEICEEHLQQHRTTYGGDNNDASASTSTAQTPTTPRIDVEQASSPSQAESGDSTPERELFDLDTATSDNLTSAFLEGAADVDLRSSAEDMGIPYSSTGSFKGRHSRNSSLLATGKSAPGSRKISWDAGDNRKRQVGDGQLERKGSGGRSGNNSDPVFFPSRDTRLSSISSNVSATSGMSALSAFSAGRRSPSPHRMQLETSFCGPKTVAAAAAKEAEEEEELLDLEASRRPSLLNPPTWFGDAGSRCASPLGTPSSPGCMRAFMFKYATEPRSRPTSPMGWHSAAPSPGPSLNVTATGDVSTRWLTSPRCQRRSSSPHRTLVETSFCGHMQIKVPEDEVAPRGPSPMPSIGSLLSIQSQPVKYATEPRSRPASPTASRSYFNLTPVPVDSRRGSQSGRCPSPMIETSFCGPKQLTRRDSQEDAIISVSNSQRPSQSSAGQNESANLRPVRYQTEPRSRPVSPNPQPQQPTIADSPHINRPARSPSPHMMRVETSFCGAKQVARQDSGQHKSIIVQQPSRDMENVTEVSIHPLPVKYATEPRSRPVSPCSLLSNHCPATPDRERRRSPSPHRMVVETSFYSSKLPVEKECPAGHPLELVVAPGETASQINQPSTPVKYATEPRSRPVSPSVNLLSNHSTPEAAGRRHRSPSPHRMLVETSFCGNKQVARQESQVEQAVIQLVEKSRLDDQEPGNLSNSSSSVAEMPAVANHLDEKTSSSLSSLTGVVVRDEHQQAIDEFPTNWPDQPVSQFAAVWPVQHLTTFELSDRKSSQGDLRSSSEETASPPSQHSNGHMVPAAKPVSSPNRPGRQLPKPVACPKPPQSFAPQYDSSAPSSPLASSPALSRRLESASPSPSSPFPSRRTSLGGALRHNNQATAEEAASESQDRKSSVTTTKSGDLSDENPQYPDTSSKTDKKGRSVLSVLFGKRTGKTKNKDQEQMDELRNGQQLEAGNRMLSLPLSSRDNSPGRSIGDSCQSGDDLDDGVGFQHQVLETGNDSCDNLVETELDGKAPVQQPPKEEMSLFHQDSIEEELPFVPTTLPIERPIAPLITPVRMRVSEVKTTATVRPRCSISFTPRSIDDYVKIARTDSLGGGQQDPVAVLQIPKIKVSLPKPEREESFDLDPSTVGAMPSIPPIKVTAGVVCSNWEAFSEQVFLRSGSRKRANKEPDTENEGVVRTESKADRTTTTTSKSSPGSTNSQWINVEELPEPVKEAKAIKVVTAGRDATKVEAVATPAAQVELLEDLDGEKSNLELPVRKDSVSSETALLREIDEADLEEDRSPPALLDEDDPSVSIRERHSQSR